MKRQRKRVGTILFLWDAVWKFFAVRRAIKNKQYRWASAMVVVSSAGILPMLYLAKWSRPQPTPFPEQSS